MRFSHGISSSELWKGYILRLNRKYITLQPPVKARPVRFKTLGKNYTPEAIRRRILYPERNSPAGNERPLPPALRTLLSERPARKVTGLQKLYVIYLFQVGVLPTKPVYMSYAVREDIRKLNQRIAQVEFILKNEIQDRGQLNGMRCAAEGEIERLLKERRGLYRRNPDSPRIQEITARLKELRRTAKLCRDIEEHSLAIVHGCTYLAAFSPGLHCTTAGHPFQAGRRTSRTWPVSHWAGLF